MKRVEFTSVPLGKRPEAKVWQVLTQQVTRGEASLWQEGERYAVQFVDEAEPIALEHLAYDREIGLYDTRLFPDVAREDGKDGQDEGEGE